MADIHEQHINIKFCFTIGKTFTETQENVYGDQCMSRARCYEWFKRFNNGRLSTRDKPRLGRPSTSCDDAHVEQVREIVRSNSRLTVQEIAKECNISVGSCHDSLATKLEMHRVVSKFVPRLLTQDQRDSRVAICQDLLDRASEDENFLKRIITGDETWVYGYDVETKMQSSLWVRKIRRERKRGSGSGRT
jgi:transposase